MICCDLFLMIAIIYSSNEIAFEDLVELIDYFTYQI